MARPDVACILTTYNRPRLVVDAIASVLEQDCDRWRLYIMDDGCDKATRSAIRTALPLTTIISPLRDVANGYATTKGNLTWWQGPQRPMHHRRASIPYSRTINVALNHLLEDEQYITYLPDDDFFYPGSIRARAEYLDAHPEAHVVYGRSRSLQYDRGGFNVWKDSVAPKAGRACPLPTGRRVVRPGTGSLVYFEHGDRDPQTGLEYVEEAHWEPGVLIYGEAGKTDHSQVMHRRCCLTDCRAWPQRTDGTSYEYWGESHDWPAGDIAFFSLLGQVHPFIGIDAWVTNKRFHAMSVGVCDAEQRE